MSNSQITSQLTRVTVPSIGNSNFAEGIRNAFETINNNFKIIASLPFIQGVQGDSYTQISKDIWTEVNNNITPVYYTLTKEGAVLLNSIFESALKDIRFNEGDSFEKCKNEKLGKLSLNGVSPIDSFFIEENGNVKLVNNKLYFYSVINNLNEEQDTYLGQYFYFVDYRITELGKVYNDKNLYDFNDFTGFYQYQPASENELEKYNAISIVPNLYYDKDKNDICWKYNGQQTGISAIGPKGEDGKDANFKIVYVQYVNDTDNSGEILGYFDSVKETIEYTNTLNNCFCLVQFVNTVTNEDNTVTITSYVDSAFGEVYKNKVYWENSLKMGNLFNNQNITRYFCNMGYDPTVIENHPYYLAIPVYLDRTNANEDRYKFGHVFSSSEDGKLVLKKANNAFTEAGGQIPLNDLKTEGTQNLFDIKNYDVNIEQNLTIDGTLGVSGTGTFGSDLNVSEFLGVSGAGNFGGNLSVSGTLGVSGTGTFGSDLTVSGALGVSGTGTFGSDLTVSGALGVSGTGTFGSDLTVSGALGVSGTGTFGSVSVSGTLGVSGSAEIVNSLTVNGGLYAKTKKPSTVVAGGTADGLSNVLIGYNDPGNSTFHDFPVDLDKGGYPLVVKSLDKDDNESDSAILIGSGDIYAISKTSDGWGPGTLHLNHRSNYFGDVRTGKNLFVGDSGRWGVGGNLTVCSNNGEDGTLNVMSASNSTEPGNGALVVAGGVGIGMDLNIGGALSTTGSATIGLDLEVINSATIGTDLKVDHDLEVTNSATIGGSLFVNKALIDSLNASGVARITGKSGANGETGMILTGGSATSPGQGAANSTYGGTGLIVSGGAPYSSNSTRGNAIEATGNIIVNSGKVSVSSGKVEASGGFFQKSDETLKDFHKDIQVDFEKLSLIPKKYFTWKSDEEKHMEIGTSAQEVLKLYPELVSEDENGILSVSYDKLSIVALKAIDMLNEKNKELEKRIEKLEQFIK